MFFTTLRPPLAIALAAVAGALCRYYLSLGVDHLLPNDLDLPVSTLFINVTGCGVMGFAATLCFHPQWQVHPDLRLMLLTGFMGAYTTFSSYELDSARLLTHHRWGADLLYWAGSALLGWLSLEGGRWLATRFHKIFRG
ncbi:MAG: fluoride efflux transporter CrcB [Gloeomargarita sp. DG02_3_bins_56]